MNKPRLDALLHNIGMTESMRPLLESDSGAYFRLEKAIDDCLNRYKDINYTTVQGDGYDRKPFKNGKPVKTDYLGTKDLQRRISWFRHYYGINDVVKTKPEIASDEKLTVTAISIGINFVSALLAQRHKYDLWYGAFEDLPKTLG